MISYTLSPVAETQTSYPTQMPVLLHIGLCSHMGSQERVHSHWQHLDTGFIHGIGQALVIKHKAQSDRGVLTSHLFTCSEASFTLSFPQFSSISLSSSHLDFTILLLLVFSLKNVLHIPSVL